MLPGVLFLVTQPSDELSLHIVSDAADRGREDWRVWKGMGICYSLSRLNKLLPINWDRNGYNPRVWHLLPISLWQNGT